MNITVFGGTGTAGLLLLKKALSNGHKVTAYARTPAKISFTHKNLSVIEGELTQLDKLEEAIQGSDVVISLLGPTGKSKTLAISTGINHVIDTMKKQGVQRLIATVSSSYRDPKDKFQFWFDFGVVVLKALANSIYRDIIETGEQVRRSSLNWTMVRLPKLSNESTKEKLYTGYTGDGKISFFSLTRTDLVDFILQQVNDNSYLRQAPVISN